MYHNSTFCTLCPTLKRELLLRSHGAVDFASLVNELLQERAVLMTDNGFPIDYMDVKYRCSKCGDTGFTDTGEKCSCYEERAREAAVWEGRS